MLFTLLAFAVALGLLITFHELGHYTVARLCGVGIQRFSIGFGPVLLRRFDRRGTEWALSAVPLGGYVKMLDDAPADARPAVRARSFNGKPLWQRFLVVLAGPAANLLLAVMIYAALGVWGTWQPAAILGAPPAGTAAAHSGIHAKDTIIAVDGHAVRSWPQARWRLLEPLALGDGVTLALKEPSGEVRTAQLSAADPPPKDALAQDPLGLAGLVPVTPHAVISSLTPGGAAQAAGLEPGDRILSVLNRADLSVQAIVQQIQGHAGERLPIVVQRGDARLTFIVEPARVDAGEGRMVGRIGALIQAEVPRVLVRLSVLESLDSGLRQTLQTSLFSLRMMGRMLTGAASWHNVTGPVTIAEYAGETARIGLESYLGFLALISISIGILNLLPIPLLDGGHLLFFVLEALRGGRPVPARIRGWGMQLGLILVLSLTFLALYNDLARLLR